MKTYDHETHAVAPSPIAAKRNSERSGDHFRGFRQYLI